VTARAFGIELRDAELEAGIHAGLAAVEELLAEAVTSAYPLVTEASRHLVDAGGKRFRPLLVLLAAQFGNPRAPGVVPAAAVVELTHLATLYHDDVMDEASMRRGAPSANSRWSNTIAILTGDFLFARAADILADLGPEAVRIQARTFERLVIGQIRESMGPSDSVDGVEHYLGVVAEKTASLIATSGRFGALMSGATEAALEVLTQFGEQIGVAFQLSDDILDVTSDSARSGKTPGTDLREGVATLPVLHALSGCPASAEDRRLRELLGSGNLADDTLRDEALQLLRGHPALDRARADLRHWADEARSTLDPLPNLPAKAALASLCDVVVDRTF
jgi:heptaprenyl diphosphate synthase